MPNVNRFLLIGLVLACAACSKVPLYGSLSEQQANEVIAALLAESLDASKERSDDGKAWAIHVAEEDIPRAMAVLQHQQLPSKGFANLGNLFEKSGFVSSPLEEKARYIYGVSQELSQTLSQLDGVMSARLHVALPEQDVFGEAAQPSSASVVIVAQRGADILDRETDIKAIVKDGIEGMNDINKVTVKFFEQAPLALDQVPQGAPARLQRDERVAEADPRLGLSLAQ